MPYLLIAEDDLTLRTGLAIALESEGYEVCACADGAEALSLFARRRPDLMLLDVMMPKMSGFEVCVEVQKADPSVPVIFLTAMSGDARALEGFGFGAVAYVEKPFSMKKLLAQIAAVLKLAATGSRLPSGADTFSVGGATVDRRRFSVKAADGVESPLTVRELGLLEVFRAHPGEVMSRADLLDAVWGMDYAGGTRTLDQHVAQVRRKLGADGDLIETVRSVGYRLHG